MKHFCLTGLLILAFFFSNAQQFEKCYGTSTGADLGVDIATLSDQSIISVGTSNSYGNGSDDIVVTKTDAAGVLLWSRYLGGAFKDQGKAVAVSDNDDIYVCGVLMGAAAGTEDFQLSKISKHGNVIWTKTFGGSNSDIVNDIAYRANKLYMFGTTKSFGAGQEDMYLVVTDTAGTVVRTKTIGTTGKDLGNCISKTSDGNFVIGGRSDFVNGSEVYAAKINTLGDTLWTKRFDCNLSANASSSYIATTSVIELSDQQILVTGTGNDNTNFLKAFHIRLDATGNQIYFKFFALTNTYVQAVDAISTSNGGYIISTDFPSGLDKYDKTGTSVWRKTYQHRVYAGGYQQSNLSGRLAKIPGSKILFTGTAYLINGSNDIYIAKLDSNGEAYTTSLPVITAAGATTFCQGDSVKLSVPSGYTTYQWVKSDNNGVRTFIPGNSNTLWVKDDGGYLCTMTKSNGVRITQHMGVHVNQYPSTTVSSSGALNFCAASGQSTTLTATAGYTSYQWNKNGIAIAGATANSYVTNSTGTYTVILTNGCGTRTSSAVAVNSTTLPVSVISCSSFDCNIYRCIGSSGSLQVANNGTGATYEWYLDNSPLQNTNASTYSPYMGGDYTCKVTNSCGTTTSSAYHVNLDNYIPFNTIQVNGVTTGCGVGPSVVLTAPNTASSSFEWYESSNLIAGAVSSTYTVTQPGFYTVKYFNTTGSCAFFPVISETMIVNPDTNSAAAISATAGVTACSGTLPLTANISGSGVTYKWFKDNVVINGAVAQTYQASTYGKYYCQISRSCGAQNSNIITLDIGSPVLPANTSVYYCGVNTVFVLPAISTYSYKWKFNNVIIPGATTNSCPVSAVGTYICEVSNSCGTTPFTVVFNSSSVTTPTISAVGGTTICTGQTKDLSVPLISGSTYWWRLGNNYVASGLNKNTYTASQPGTYTVEVYTTSCNVSAQIIILSDAITLASIKTIDYPQICTGTPLLLKGSSNNNVSYKWYRNNAVIAGAVDSFYNAKSGGEYQYSMSNVCKTVTSQNFHVNGKALPTAVVTPLSSVNFCNGDSVILQASADPDNNYDWYKYSAHIANAYEDKYTAKKAGKYTAVITNKFGCAKKSNDIFVTVPCREGNQIDETAFTNVNIYPNPSSDIVYVEVTGSEDLQMEILDTQGRSVQATVSRENDKWIISNLEGGMYILKASSESFTVSKIFVIAK